jgi:lipopolysaccharide/colanic/teichoic acid biosynthesis glycosyltransferase
LNTSAIDKTVPLVQKSVAVQNGIIRSFVATRKKYLWLKRCFDWVFSSLIIITLLSWLIPLLWVIIRMDSKGPVFFRQKRIGKNGRMFSCIKFRTMVVNTEADEMPAEKNDPRITSVGRILRMANIDELPQFLNVWLGQMSVVGPRPHMVSDCIRFSFIISSYSFRHLLRPGITGWAQVHGYHGPTSDYESIMVRYYWDAQYIRKAGLWLDLKIIFATVVRSLRHLVRV